jgi:hypothetical protein
MDADPASSTGTHGRKPTADESAEAGAAPASDIGSDLDDLSCNGNGAGDDESCGLTTEELAQLSERTAKRLKLLMAQRNEARDRVKELSAQIEALKPDALIGRSIVLFVMKAKLSTDEMTQGFEIMGLMRTDPVKAREMLAPYWDALQSITNTHQPHVLN